MKYEFDKSNYNIKKIQDLNTGDLFVEEGEETVFMATDENDSCNTLRRCVNLENGLIIYFDMKSEVRTVTLVEPPIFGYA